MKTANVSIKESRLMFPYSSYNNKFESEIRRNSVFDKLARNPNVGLKNEDIQDILTMKDIIKKKNYRKKNSSTSNKILQKILITHIKRKLYSSENYDYSKKTSKTTHNLFHLKSNLLQKYMNDKIETNKIGKESSLRMSKDFNNRSEYYTQDSFVIGDSVNKRSNTIFLKNFSPILKPNLFLTADSNFLDGKSTTFPKIDLKEENKVDYKKLYNTNIIKNRVKFKSIKHKKDDKNLEKKPNPRRVYFNTTINPDPVISLNKEPIRSILKKGNSESKASMKRTDFDKLVQYQTQICENTYSSCELNDSIETKGRNNEYSNVSNEKKKLTFTIRLKDKFLSKYEDTLSLEKNSLSDELKRNKKIHKQNFKGGELNIDLKQDVEVLSYSSRKKS